MDILDAKKVGKKDFGWGLVVLQGDDRANDRVAPVFFATFVITATRGD